MRSLPREAENNTLMKEVPLGELGDCLDRDLSGLQSNLTVTGDVHKHNITLSKIAIATGKSIYRPVGNLLRPSQRAF